MEHNTRRIQNVAPDDNTLFQLPVVAGNDDSKWWRVTCSLSERVEAVKQRLSKGSGAHVPFLFHGAKELDPFRTLREQGISKLSVLSTGRSAAVLYGKKKGGSTTSRRASAAAAAGGGRSASGSGTAKGGVEDDDEEENRLVGGPWSVAKPGSHQGQSKKVEERVAEEQLSPVRRSRLNLNPNLRVDDVRRPQSAAARRSMRGDEASAAGGGSRFNSRRDDSAYGDAAYQQGRMRPETAGRMGRGAAARDDDYYKFGGSSAAAARRGLPPVADRSRPRSAIGTATGATPYTGVGDKLRRSRSGVMMSRQAVEAAAAEDRSRRMGKKFSAQSKGVQSQIESLQITIDDLLDRNDHLQELLGIGPDGERIAPHRMIMTPPVPLDLDLFVPVFGAGGAAVTRVEAADEREMRRMVARQPHEEQRIAAMKLQHEQEVVVRRQAALLEERERQVPGYVPSPAVAAATVAVYPNLIDPPATVTAPPAQASAAVATNY